MVGWTRESTSKESSTGKTTLCPRKGWRAIDFAWKTRDLEHENSGLKEQLKKGKEQYKRHLEAVTVDEQKSDTPEPTTTTPKSTLPASAPSSLSASSGMDRGDDGSCRVIT